MGGAPSTNRGGLFGLLDHSLALGALNQSPRYLGTPASAGAGGAFQGSSSAKSALAALLRNSLIRTGVSFLALVTKR